MITHVMFFMISKYLLILDPFLKKQHFISPELSDINKIDQFCDETKKTHMGYPKSQEHSRTSPKTITSRETR